MSIMVATGRALAGLLPALLLVIGAVAITIVALFLAPARREFALTAVDRLIRLARVVVGTSGP
jgi:hypothetical protein